MKEAAGVLHVRQTGGASFFMLLDAARERRRLGIPPAKYALTCGTGERMAGTRLVRPASFYGARGVWSVPSVLRPP